MSDTRDCEICFGKNGNHPVSCPKHSPWRPRRNQRPQVDSPIKPADPLHVDHCPRCGSTDHRRPGPVCGLREILESYCPVKKEDGAGQETHWCNTDDHRAIDPEQYKELLVLLAYLEGKENE